MSKSKKDIEEDMSQTFIAEVGQKSAIADDNFNEIEEVKNQSENKEDTVEYEDNSNMYNEKAKKSHPVLIVFLIILALVIGAFGSYYFFEVLNKKDDTTKKVEVLDKTNKEELNPDGLYVKELISRYDYAAISDNTNIYENLYKNEKTLVKDIDENYLKTLAANLATNLDGYFDKDDFNDAVKILYGKELTFDDEDIKYDKACINIKYEDNSYSYIEGECNKTSTTTMKRKIVKTKVDDDILEVNVAVAVVDTAEDKVYKNYSENKEELEEVENMTATTFDIDKDYPKLNQYKYTFNYDKENNNYYLVSIELDK